MYSVDVHPDVYGELEYSRAWYEERAVNLGTEFLVEVDRAIETVRESPAIWPFRDEPRSIRRYLVHRFPYGVIYRIREHTVQVLAVMNLRRHPDSWRERVRYWNGDDMEQPKRRKIKAKDQGGFAIASSSETCISHSLLLPMRMVEREESQLPRFWAALRYSY